MNMEEMTLGVEEEYQIIDPDSRELTSYISEFLEKGKRVFRDQVKPEFLQSQVEMGTEVCRDIKEVRKEIARLRSMVSEIAEKSGHRIVAAGTHPFSRWQEQEITEKDRYRSLVADLQYVARRLLIFGMHIHVGIPDRELRIDTMNQISYFMPHFWLFHPHPPSGWETTRGSNPTGASCSPSCPGPAYPIGSIPPMNTNILYRR